MSVGLIEPRELGAQLPPFDFLLLLMVPSNSYAISTYGSQLAVLKHLSNFLDSPEALLPTVSIPQKQIFFLP